MTREEAKDVFLNRGFIEVEGCRGRIFHADKWREACIVISKALEQEPKSEWQQDHAILKAYSDGANEVLDKIRAELIQLIQNGTLKIESGNEALFNIIDKYKVESEDKA